MFADLQNILGIFQNFIILMIISMAVITCLSLIGIRKLWIGSSLLGWYGIFITNQRIRPISISILFLRMLYMISMIFVIDSLSYLHLILYLILEGITILLVFRWNYTIYAVFYNVVVAVLTYELYLLKIETHKVEVRAGMKFLYYGTVIFFILAAILQFFITLNQMIQKKALKTEVDQKIRKISFCVLPVCLLICVVPMYIIHNIDYIYIEHGAYQVIGGVRNRYEGSCRVTNSDQGCMIETDQESSILDTSPLYFVDDNELMITKTCSIVQPNLQLTNRLNKLSLLSWKEDNYQILYGEKKIKVEDFFLFDGKDTYYFPKNTQFTWGNQSIQIDSFCQVTVKYNQNVTIYDLEHDAYTEYDTGNSYCIATLEGKEQINLSTDILYRENGEEQMLFLQPSLLKDIE